MPWEWNERRNERLHRCPRSPEVASGSCWSECLSTPKAELWPWEITQSRHDLENTQKMKGSLERCGLITTERRSTVLLKPSQVLTLKNASKTANKVRPEYQDWDKQGWNFCKSTWSNDMRASCQEGGEGQRPVCGHTEPFEELSVLWLLLFPVKRSEKMEGILTEM